MQKYTQLTAFPWHQWLCKCTLMLYVIWGFCHEADENCTLLGCYGA